MRAPKFKVGDKVCLNCYGLRQIFGSDVGNLARRKVLHTVTEIDDVSITEPEAYVMWVSDAALSKFLLNDNYFDLVSPAGRKMRGG